MPLFVQAEMWASLLAEVAAVSKAQPYHQIRANPSHPSPELNHEQRWVLLWDSTLIKKGKNCWTTTAEKKEQGM